ncbi:hypothetical protein VTK56DRAFT_9606 [Thermocarpiscus australiensis]
MASAPAAAASEVFDASKQGKAPSKFLCSAPRDAPAVRVAFVSPAVGYGLFAARDFAPDEFIFHEAPLMTALFNEKFAADRQLVQSQVSAYRGALAASRDVTAVAFPALAARFGIAPLPFDQAEPVLASELGRNLVHGRFAGSTVTREQYEAYTSRLSVAKTTTTQPIIIPSADARDACLDFFKHYAFEVHQSSTPLTTTSGGGGGGSSTLASSTTRPACIYLLGSLINHCCTPPSAPTTTSPSRSTSAFHRQLKQSSKSLLSKQPASSGSSPAGPDSKKSDPVPPPGPNCSWRIGPSGLAHFVKPRHICVQARRAIREGEQLTWDYGKRDKGFDCECETCREGFMGMGYLCGVL